MRRRIGVSQNNNLQADSLEINNGLTASLKLTYDGSSDITFKLPATDGSNGWALKTDGSGSLSFGAVSTSGGSQSLQEVTTIGNTTSNNIQFGSGVGIVLNNGSILREGTIDAGLGGTKGIAQICSVGYELKWEAGVEYVMNNNGNAIRHSLYNFTTTPTSTDDTDKGYYVGSLWSLDDMTTYICTDATSGSASWSLYNYGATQRYIGEEYGGGIIGALWYDGTEQKGLILATQTFGPMPWSNVTGATAGASSSTDGYANTQMIINQVGHVSSAAKVCDDYVSGTYSDWYLGSPEEFQMTMTNARTINMIWGIGGYTQVPYSLTQSISYGYSPYAGPTTGGINPLAYYWTSTEYWTNGLNAWWVSFGLATGFSAQIKSDVTRYVRPMRRL
jgi:hypothetical protein